ncbi:MAG: hypothetical protein ACREDJ_06390, partial [Methylocella sp.]
MSAPYKFDRSRRHKFPGAIPGEELTSTFSQENAGMSGALSANGDQMRRHSLSIVEQFAIFQISWNLCRPVSQ